ncbi:MAG TPA: hypothetical protein VJL61_14450 [Rhodanobacteraceae bacterium]|nr:hypothetical protein [Rhodanobacteraceae bacterium]
MLGTSGDIEHVRCGHVLGRQHPFARLQADAMFAFQPFQDALGLCLPRRDDLRQFLEQRFPHEPFASIESTFQVNHNERKR